jgi:hypothetical protein
MGAELGLSYYRKKIVLEQGAEENILAQKQKEVKRLWMEFCNKEFHKFYSSPNVGMITSRKMKWTRLCSGENRKAYKVLVGKSKGKRPLERTNIDGRIIKKWILKK